MAYTHVQSSATTTGTATSAAITLSATVAGNTVVVHVYMASTSATVTSVTDDKGNSYSVSSRQNVAAGTHSATQAYGLQSVGGVTAVTVNFSGSVTFAVGADEFGGNANFDVRAVASPGNVTSSSVSGFTPSAAGNLIVVTAVAGSSRNFTAGTNYTGGLDPTSHQVWSEYRLNGTTSETAPFTINSATQVAEIATSFKPSAPNQFFFGARL